MKYISAIKEINLKKSIVASCQRIFYLQYIYVVKHNAKQINCKINAI